ncbi:hypothetical protein A8C75_01830 [Marinobacterium aestuarii]|uniref:DUF4870 domain-containing protein n=1 Tax=Marinobacterium aestuarii TaxID=1821621 RepID=A0A1A9ETW6_9GAMM|nr:hypothetical protein [Marinobacterium aestuarii]ANG61325.1 hypothetical protein A8C75_01830 [Marinobacterium aestuarii]
MTQDLSPDPSDKSATQQHGGNARIIYILYLVSLVVGITALVGLVMAYVYRSEATDCVKAHYSWQIRTFWIGLLYTLLGALLTGIGVGFLILLFAVIWFIVRCVKGLQCLERREAPANPGSWLF